MAINFLTTTNTLPEIQINDTGNNPRLELQESGIVSGGISTTGGALVFEASSGIERARISSVGLFGIGKIPSQWILDVDSANAYIASFDGSGNTGVVLNSNNSTAAQIIGYSNSVSAYNDLDIRSNSTTGSGIYIDGSTSRVGVGTNTPSKQLHIRGSAPWIRIEEDSASNKRLDLYVNPSTAIGIIAANQSAQQLSFQTGNTDRLRITNAGNVGIGTVSPTHKLHVAGTTSHTTVKVSTTTHNANFEVKTNNSNYALIGQGSSNRFDIWDTNAGATRVSVNSSGNLGIGTTNPTYKLDVNGDAARIGSSSQTTTTLYLTATNTAGAPAMASQIIMQGYEGRGIGTFYQDTTYGGEEWFSGLPYSGSFNYYQIGYDASGGQAEYATSSLFRVYHTGKTILSTYGSGTHTGTAAKYLAVTSSGEIIETGSGGNLPGGPYLPLAGGTMTGTTGIHMPDNFALKAGNSQDLKIYHEGTDSIIQNYTGSIYIDNNADNQDIVFRCDDGSGGITNYIQIDGSELRTTFNKTIRLNDVAILQIGNDADLRLYHNGTNSNIENFTGTLQVIQNVNDGDISFKCDDGSGGTTEYFRLDGGTVQTLFSKEARFLDNISAQFGSAGELRLYHTGTGSVIQNSTGNLTIQQDQNDGDIIFRSDDGSGGTAIYFACQGSGVETLFYKRARWADNVEAQFGASADLKIYHDGSNSYITDSGTGNLLINSNGASVQINKGLTENMAEFITDGAVKLYYDSARKFETTSAGVEITGNLDSPTISINDYISHNGDTNTYLGYNGADSFELVVGGTQKITADSNAAYLRYQGGAKLETTSAGVSITGQATASEFYVVNNNFGLDTDSNYLQIRGYDGYKFYNTQASEVHLTIDPSGNVTFVGQLTIPEQIYHTGDANTYFGFNANDTWRVVTGGSQRLDINNNGVRIGGGARVTTILDEDNMASDSATALATQQSIKAYVDSSITGSTTYRGTWDPDVSLNSGYGNPNLNTVTKQDGYYYICSDNGSATPNGSGTEPNSWHTGDWVVYNSDLGSSGEWQKIDNTSVLSGTGTGQKVAKWDGSGTSETLADGPITFSNNDSTFSGNVTVTNNLTTNLLYTDFIQTRNGTKIDFRHQNASVIMTVDTDDARVGIGTTTPTAPLHIEGATNSEVLKIEADSNPFIRWVENGTDVGFLQFLGDHAYLSNMSNGSFFFRTNNTTRMTLSSAGNLGIGTTSPSTKLHVYNGEATIASSTDGVKLSYSNGNSSGVIDTAFSDNALEFRTNGTSKMFIANAGNIGIGTNNPTQKLDVNGAIITQDYRSASTFYLTSGDDWRFRSDTGSERMRITSGGNVGIGINSPVAKLHVYQNNSDDDTTAGVTIEQDGTGDAALSFLLTSVRRWRLGIDNNDGDKFKISDATNLASSNRFTIDTSGNVGIGASSPLSKLHIDSSEAAMHFTRSGQETYRVIHGTSGLYFSKPNSGGLAFGVTQNSDFHTFDTSGNVLFAADASTGRVGIGTSSPTYDLSVAGAISGAGFVTYTKSYGSLDTTGNAVAGITTGSNGASCGFTFTCFGGAGKYQRIVYSCYNDSGTWRPKKVIDEGTNDLDVTASSDGATITFTFKARSSSQSYTPRVKVEADGQSINSTYA